jgi:hypothetical protein
MFAIIAAVLFGLALLLELIDENLGSLVTPTTLLYAGLLFVAIHLSAPTRRWRRR